MIRVLIIDDSLFMRRAISRMIAGDRELEVIDTAINGQMGLEKIRALRPDVVTMDVEMPVMDGLSLLRALRSEPRDARPAVLMCSSLTRQGSHAALQAMSLGAGDIILKDPAVVSAGSAGFQHELIAKLKALGGARKTARPPAPPAPRPLGWVHRGPPELVLIGSSTGGPPVLETILAALPERAPFPVVIAQHMPPLFTRTMAERLDQLCKVRVRHGDANTTLEPGSATIIVGGRHGRVAREGGKGHRLIVGDEPRSAPFKPSVNELLDSGAAFGPRCLGIVLTGMGDDGAVGAGAMARAGGTVLSQDEGSSVVYGMPRAVAEAGHSRGSFRPKELGALLAELASRPPVVQAA
ncbi:MAG: chemotaxis-specific protein-glutamate methyltransferase CheB [Phycisphaerae bacterium]|nr:chemotaxis-specific protein-glutamate methyltransferase CheB [Phycisphaerae bacterium]